LEGLGYSKASIITGIPVFLVLPFRLYAHVKNRKVFQRSCKPESALYPLPWKEFKADLLSWPAAGLLMAALYFIYFDAPYFTGLKVFLGCLSFGLFGGMLSFLAIEKHIIDRLQTLKVGAAPAPEKLLPVSRKMLFFMVTVLVFTVLVMLLMFFQDINYLLTHKDALGPQIYSGVFKEILFAFSILLVLSFVILARYSRNLKRILEIQVNVMKDVSGGEYYTQVPVVSNDEFGLIASKTNDMIGGLRERDLCRLSFGKYVTPEVSEKILNGEISPEGESSEVTVLFCDLRGYTPFVERKDPKDVVKFLNLYFTRMEETIRKHNGIVLQYIGDEIEAVFGAPIHEPNHPRKAVMAALEMRKRLDGLNRERKKMGEASIQHGIGIHTGMVLAGSVGSPERLVYAMVGDTVNVASRIQGLNKQFQTDILVSRKTMALLPPGEFELVSLGRTPIRGKSEEIEVFKVL